MTYLRNHCLGRQPMTHDEVNAIYKSGKCPGLCMSHERLRAELTGLEIVATENEAIVERMDALIQKLEANGIGVAMRKSLKEVRGTK